MLLHDLCSALARDIGAANVDASAMDLAVEAKTTAWTGFGDYVESLGTPMSGGGEGADFEAMVTAALAKEASAKQS